MCDSMSDDVLNVVLIETYWNVNFPERLYLTALHFVLIETYWNVNKFKAAKAFKDAGINRNILECKYDIRNHRGTGHDRINRNILECKSVILPTAKNTSICINRNILECKSRVAVPVLVATGVLIETYWNVNAERTGLSPAFCSINRNILECK